MRLDVLGWRLVDLGYVLDILLWKALKGQGHWRQWCRVCELAIEGERPQLQVEAPEGNIVGYDYR